MPDNAPITATSITPFRHDEHGEVMLEPNARTITFVQCHFPRPYRWNDKRDARITLGYDDIEGVLDIRLIGLSVAMKIRTARGDVWINRMQWLGYRQLATTLRRFFPRSGGGAKHGSIAAH